MFRAILATAGVVPGVGTGDVMAVLSVLRGIAASGLILLPTAADAGFLGRSAAPPAEFVVYFGPGSDALDARAQSVIELAALAARAEAAASVTVAGYSDSAGDWFANEAIAQRRAVAVLLRLAKAGVPAALLKIENYGEANLAVVSGDDRAEAANRRVAIRF